MKAHIVLAHPEPRSYNAHMADVAAKALQTRGWSVTQIDLYAAGFDPCEGAAHYSALKDPARFDVQSEQKAASDGGTIPAIVGAEIENLDRADLVILQYPMWWHLPPAILKGWLDRVFMYGEVYTGQKRFENGRFRGKKVMLSVTVGTSRETYAYNGRSGDIDMILWPVNFSLAFVGFDVLKPFVAYGVEGGLRYSAQEDIDRRLKGWEEDYAARLQGIEKEVPVPFNVMSDWGSDGRIKPTAAVYSPFVRHKEQIDIS